MASVYGDRLRVSIFGQSHGEAIGVVVDGLPAGKRIDMERLYAFLERRAPGKNRYSTARAEPDKPEFLSGLVDDVTCGAPLCAIIRNVDTSSKDYAMLKDVMRPGHADFTAKVKHGGYNDYRGGGHFSGRLTAPLCIAGAICVQLLEQEGIEIGAHIYDIAGASDIAFDPISISSKVLNDVRCAQFPVLSQECGNVMQELIENARMDNDSLGGIIECAVIGLPVGLGEPMFDGVENKIAGIIFGVPAVRGIEFGNGFVSTLLRGSANNDSFYVDEEAVKSHSNNHGGVLGGMTSGMPLIFRTAIKPTPSIAREQTSVKLTYEPGQPAAYEDTKLSITGRHDPCIVPRAVPCIEAAAAIAILDMML